MPKNGIIHRVAPNGIIPNGVAQITETIKTQITGNEDAMNPFKYGCTVEGDFFCPRPALEQKLASYIKSGQNVVIQGERRTGKTSLVLETIRNMKGIALFHADFLAVRDLADLCERIVSALARLERTDTWLAKTLRTFSHLRPVMSVDQNSGAPTISLDTRIANEPSSLNAVLDAILGHTAKRKVCVVLDEFQDILDIEDGERILAVMRGRIQLDSNTSYIFLGSVRNRMTEMFWRPSSPFYHSAAAFPVGEIDEEEFFRFIRRRFATEKRILPQKTFDAIYAVSNRNPGYTQELCEALWLITSPRTTLTPEDITRALGLIFDREREHFAFFIKQLTPLQTRVLKTIAEIGGKEPYSSRFCETANVHNTTAIKKAIAKIEKEDLAYWFDGEYRFVNPFFREWIKQR